jgi:hypothetical protein
MTTRPEQPFITSVRVEPVGAHETVAIWIRGQCVGTLTVGKGDGEPLAAILRGSDVLAAMRRIPDDKLRMMASGQWCGHGQYAACAESVRRAQLDGVSEGEACTEEPQHRASVDELRRRPGELTRCPPGLQPDARTLELTAALRFDAGRVLHETRRFVDYHTSVRPEPRRDWQALLRGWLRRAAEPVAGFRYPAQALEYERPFHVDPSDAHDLQREALETLHGLPPGKTVQLTAVGPLVIEGPEPPPGNWAFFEGDPSIIDRLVRDIVHPTAEAGPGAPAPSPPAANQQPGLESRPPGAPPVAGAPPTKLERQLAVQRGISHALFPATQPMPADDEDAWREEETIG